MPPQDETALGLVETMGLVAAIEAADAMAKVADVRIIDKEQTDAALITIKIVGEVAAVQAAVDAGAAAAERVGKVVSRHVIPRPDASVRAEFFRPDAIRKPRVKTGSNPSSGEQGSSLERMTVQELRSIARSKKSFPLKGRQIARANKGELIRLIRGE